MVVELEGDGGKAQTYFFPVRFTQVVLYGRHQGAPAIPGVPKFLRETAIARVLLELDVAQRRTHNLKSNSL